MPDITFDRFRGLAPKIRDLKLAEGMAQVAENCVVDSGSLKPLYRDRNTGVAASTTDKSLYFYPPSGWIRSSQLRSYVKSFLANDVRQRLFYTDENFPKVRSGSAIYRLGVPKPDPIVVGQIQEPVLDEDGEPTGGYQTATNAPDNIDNAIELEYVSWVCTFVTGWGEEGPTSDPTVSTYIKDDDKKFLSLPTLPTGQYNWNQGKIRLYRANLGSSGSGIYQYVAEFPVTAAGTEIEETVNSEFLQEAAVTTNWFGPPDDDRDLYPDGPLRGLVELPNSTLAGYTGNAVYMSEPGVPYAWPPSYVRSTSRKIVGLCPTSDGVLVLTLGKPYLLVGADPDSSTIVEIEQNQPCVSRRSIVDMGGYCIYASAEGLVAGSGMDLQLATTDLMNKEDWQKYNPATLFGVRWNNRYLGFYQDDEGITRGFIFDPRREGGAVLTHLTGETVVSTVWHDETTDATYLSKRESGAWNIYAFGDTSTPLTLRWQSKDKVAPERITLNAFRVEGDHEAGNACTVRVYGDKELVDEIDMDSNDPERLVAGDQYRRWSFEVESTAAVDFMSFASSMEELK